MTIDFGFSAGIFLGKLFNSHGYLIELLSHVLVSDTQASD